MQSGPPSLLIALALAGIGMLFPKPGSAQDAKPEDQNAVNSKSAPSSLMADSPVRFPEKGALPARFPPDRKTRSYPVEEDYYLFDANKRSLAQIRAIQREMPPGTFQLPPADWTFLARTKHLLETGGDLHILGLGDSIVNDTFRSGWVVKLNEAYPRADLRATVYVRGGGGCRHYREQERIQTYLAPRKPDLVLIGGISQQKDLASIRDVVRQIRDALPEVEFLLFTGAFGSVDPRRADLLAEAQHSGTSSYGADLQRLAAELECAYLDMTRPWRDYLLSAELHPHRFYRDRVHANEYGEQVLSKILVAFFQSEATPSLSRP